MSLGPPKTVSTSTVTPSIWAWESHGIPTVQAKSSATAITKEVCCVFMSLNSYKVKFCPAVLLMLRFRARHAVFAMVEGP